MNKSCKYCNSKLISISCEENYLYNITILYCIECRAEYFYISNDKLSSISLYTSINDKIYRWTEIINGVRQLWHVIKYERPGSRSLINNKKILTIKNSSINLNPKNIQEKIKSYLNFS
jgi:hypothetical protein